MMKVQDIVGGGPLSGVVEHGGDLVNRMSKVFHQGGYEYAKSKIFKVHNSVTQGYGFEKEVLEVAEQRAKDLEIPLEEYLIVLKRELKQFAEEHKKLPAYNEAHRNFRDFNVAIGEWRFKDAKRIIKQINSKLSRGKKFWDEYALEMLDPPTKEDRDFWAAQNKTRTDTNVVADGGVEPEVVVEDKPKVIAKPEPKKVVTEERQQIGAIENAKENEPGFKRTAIPGTNKKVVTPDGSIEAERVNEIVSLSEITFAEGELQKRDRDRQQSEDTARGRAAKFDPPQVTEYSRTTDSGSPLISQSGVIR